jgi:hypothetical protein
MPDMADMLSVSWKTSFNLKPPVEIALVITEWSKVKNWACVVLPRVKTLSGLFLMSPIPEDIYFWASKRIFGHDAKFKAKDSCNT